MLESLKHTVYKCNMMLVKYNLVTFTWGNVSGIDRTRGLVVIKPSGVDFDVLTSADMVVVDLDGNIVDGEYRPSSDMYTHLELYKNFENIGGVVHVHSVNATSFAQAMRDIPAYGTTHADYFYGDIPCTRVLADEELKCDYEKNTGKVIVETFANKNPIDIPGVLVANHGPFCWGQTPQKAVHNSVVMEEVAKMAISTEILRKETTPIKNALLEKHYFRQNGANAYYGQK